MGELKYRAEISVNGLNESVKIISTQIGRIENSLREFKTMAESAERIEEENIRLKKEIEDRGREYEKKLAEATKK